MAKTISTICQGLSIYSVYLLHLVLCLHAGECWSMCCVYLVDLALYLKGIIACECWRALLARTRQHSFDRDRQATLYLYILMFQHLHLGNIHTCKVLGVNRCNLKCLADVPPFDSCRVERQKLVHYMLDALIMCLSVFVTRMPRCMSAHDVCTYVAGVVCGHSHSCEPLQAAPPSSAGVI